MYRQLKYNSINRCCVTAPIVRFSVFYTGTLWFDPTYQIIKLSAKTQAAFERGSRCIDKTLKQRNVSVPDDFSQDDLTHQDWKKTLVSIKESNPEVDVQFQVYIDVQ